MGIIHSELLAYHRNLTFGYIGIRGNDRNTVIRAFLHCKRHRIHKTRATVRIYCMISTMVGYHNMLQPTGLSESASN